MKKTFFYLFLLLSIGTTAQESIIKEFSEPRRENPWFNPVCFYPSTLRMINITGDPNYYELVNDIEKVLIYTLDSTTVAGEDYKSWLKDYEEIGYEEYIRLYGRQNVTILGKEDEFVGLMAAEANVITFYLRGEIPFHKIPLLMETFNSGDVLSVVTDRFK